ncbi:MAG TPA: hypothetical protein VGL97_17145 [Bryobacteraceae bacterium]|jgi:hypothetical protein
MTSPYRLGIFVLSLSFAMLARADYINGIAWSVTPATAASAPTLGNTPGAGSTEVATFSANGIDFSGDGPGAYNLGGFLNSGGTAGNIVYMNGATAATDLNNTEWEFTGSASFTNGEVFNVAHDDGVNMYINGSPVLLDGGPTAPVTSTFTYSGPTGTYGFDFIYVECCGGTADFKTTLVPSSPTSSSPESSTAILLSGGLLLLEPLRRRFRRS